jgi:omega-amidase
MLRIALLQVKCGSHDKAANYEIVEKAISAAVDKRANFVVLPEMWSSPYEVSKFAEFAETVSLKTSPTFEKLSSWARMFKITLVGGSIAERDEEGETELLFRLSFLFPL